MSHHTAERLRDASKNAHWHVSATQTFRRGPAAVVDRRLDDREQAAERAVDAAGLRFERRLVGRGEAQRQARADRGGIEDRHRRGIVGLAVMRA